MKLNDIGALLLIAINNNTQKNKDLLMLKIDDNKKNIIANTDLLNKQKEFYLNNYELKREQNNAIYEEYLHNRRLLLNKWKMTNKLQDLQQLVIYPMPKLYDIDETYTYDIITSKLK